MLKVVNLTKFFSGILFLFILLLVYAYMPIMVKLDPEATTQVHKENFFYFGLALFTALNTLILFAQSMINKRLKGEVLQSWIGGFTFVFNLYLTFLIGFLGVLNNPSHIEASSYAYLNWLGPFMIFSWFIGLIFILLKKK
tara:strand:+ start:382 stop:801 length:420 start_codon:yes stop_codon:yes gene_type:complete